MEYTSYIFEVHNPLKFENYTEIKNIKGFSLPSENNEIVYLLDDNDGWADLNGCYYDTYCKPAGWVILSVNCKRFQRFNMNTDFVEEKENKYYSSKTFNARDNLLEKRDKDKQSYKNEKKSAHNKQLNDQPEQKISYKYEPKFESLKEENIQSENAGKDKVEAKQEATQQEKEQEQQQDEERQETRKKKQKQHDGSQGYKKKPYYENERQVLYIEKQSSQEQGNMVGEKQSQEQKDNSKYDNPRPGRQDKQQNQEQRQYRNNKRNNKGDHPKNEIKEEKEEDKKYYILDIKLNTLNKEEFLKMLSDQYKIDPSNVLEFEDGKLKLVSEKQAISLYRSNQNEQSEQQQQFIVST